MLYDRNSILRSMIKDVGEAALGDEMTGFLGYDRYQTVASDAGNRRRGGQHPWPAPGAGDRPPTVLTDAPPRHRPVRDAHGFATKSA
ncbi:MAG: hypothetical protein ACP59X_02610 [Solidesulfovibrio sp. DCME]|uniref:hypothetical protein n=1 Tax=Solidesulfovibrio sp. DCME TaxID=3447380 RepID=UPI003D14EF11